MQIEVIDQNGKKKKKKIYCIVSGVAIQLENNQIAIVAKGN